MKVWIDGRLVDDNQATVPLLSFSFSRGVAPFEVARIVDAVNGPAVFAYEEHMDRFINTAKLMYMDLPYNREELHQAIVDVTRANKVTAGVLKYFAYYPQISLRLTTDDLISSVAVFADNYESMGIDPAGVNPPVMAGVASYKKIPPDTVPIQAKVTGNYIGAYLSKMEMAQKGIDGLIQLTHDGFVAESSTLTVLFVKDGVIKTPPLSRALAGTTRRVALAVADDLGIRVDDNDITANELMNFDEAFFTSSITGVQPIISIEGIDLAHGAPGPVTRAIMEGMEQAYRGTMPEFEHYLVYI